MHEKNRYRDHNSECQKQRNANGDHQLSFTMPSYFYHYHHRSFKFRIFNKSKRKIADWHNCLPMSANNSFAVDLEQLEKAIQEKEQNNRGKAISDLTGNIGFSGDSPRKRLNNKVDLDNNFDTLDEPIIETINRDLKLLCDKFSQVLFPSSKEQNLLSDWDLWGPLFICVFLSLLLQQGAEKGAQFTQIFSLAFFGSLVVTLNAKLLKGKISFFQALCVIGYCLLPFIFSSLAIKGIAFLLKTKSQLNLLLRLTATIFGFIWAFYASTMFLAGSQPPKRKFLSYYPLVLFYFVFAWLVISYA